MCFVMCKKKKKLTPGERKRKKEASEKALANVASQIIAKSMGRYL